MNEKIKQLADKAGINFSSHWAHEGVDTAVITEGDLKEFAELIILECCKVSEEIEPLELPHKTSKFIKLHFGIDE